MTSRHPVPSRGRRRAAFTLIELLTVIAIIGILAAILIPTVGAVRKRAAQAKAQSSLRQIGSAFHLYATENKDTFPKPGGNRPRAASAGQNNDYSWDAVLISYLNIPFERSTEAGYQDMPKPGGFISPESESLMKHPLDERTGSDPARGVRTWMMNGAFQGHATRRLSAFTTPLTGMILVGGAMADNGIAYVGSGSNAAGNLDRQTTDEKIRAGLDFYKNGKTDYLMADGHVKVMKPMDTLNGSRNINFPPSLWAVQ